jgi:hypothetical protein
VSGDSLEEGSEVTVFAPPGGQVVSRGELVHVDSNFGNYAPSRGPVETRDLG